MHEINDIIVCDGKLVLTQLPYADGQHVRVLVVESNGGATAHRSISKVRELLKGCADESADLTEPMIPSQDWEMLK